MHYVIVGNGVAGISAARAIRDRDASGEITVISDESDFLYSRTALMYIAMDTMTLQDTEPYERQWYRRNRIVLRRSRVEGVDTGARLVRAGTVYPYDRLLLATGAVPQAQGWPGRDLSGVVYFVSLDHLRELVSVARRARRAVVVGGGLIGIELAEVLRAFGLEVTYLIRGPHYWSAELTEAEGRYVERIMEAHGVKVRVGIQLQAIEGRDGHVRSVTVSGGEQIPCELVGIATGVMPNTELARSSGIPCGRGVLADWELRTSVGGVYTAGDCAEIGKTGLLRSIWYSARDMGIVAGRNMSGERVRYDPGEWYNSAKFFDREYTAAGKTVRTDPAEGEYVYQDAFHSVRIVHKDGRLLGFSLIGSRWDHAELLSMVREDRDVEYFLTHWRRAWFDTELTPVPTLGPSTDGGASAGPRRQVKAPRAGANG